MPFASRRPTALRPTAPRPTPLRLLVLTLVGALALAGCATAKHQLTVPTDASQTSGAAPGPVPVGLERFYSQTLDWSGCGSLECASMTVPLDYSQPSGQTITIRVARSPSSKHLGSVVTNPGGPGASGVEFLSSFASAAGKLLAASEDLVSFDPRGTGESSPVTCLDTAGQDALFAFDVDGSTQTGRDAARKLYDAFGQACAKNTGTVLAHVDTISTARDMDVLRALLGEQKLSYLGFSYGTELGATYAALFPTNVGQFVLDGALDPTLTPTELSVGQAAGFESAMRAYVTDCLASASCPLSGSVDQAMAQIGTMLSDARTTPISTGTDRKLTGSMAFYAVAGQMYVKQYWPYLTQALTSYVDDRDGSALLDLADQYLERGTDGYTSNTMEAFYAINCADTRDDPSPDAMIAQAAQIKAAAPTVWEYFSWGGLVCQDWPTTVATPLTSYAAQGAPPIMVVGTSDDPATPYAWAQSLAKTLSSGFLVTRKGEGHTAYLSGNSCIVTVVDQFLVQDTKPADGKTC